MIREKQFYRLGSGGKKKNSRRYGWQALYLTHPHTCAHKEKQKTPQANTHSAKHRYKLICMVKHTEQHTKDLKVSQGLENTRRRRTISRTLAEKQHPPVGGISSEKAEKSSVLDQWLLWAVPQGKENHFFLLSGSRVGTAVCVMTDAGKASQNIIRPCVGKSVENSHLGRVWRWLLLR